MKKEKHIKNSQDIKDMNGEPKVRHSMSENGEEREVDLRDIVGSKGKNKEENNK